MKFKCNNTEYEIIEKEKLENEEDVGLTDYQNKQVLLKKLDKDFMIKTLKHELAHVWMYEYGHNQTEKEFNCEDVCEIVACSNDFINKVVKEYAKPVISVNVNIDTKKFNKDINKLKKQLDKAMKESIIKMNK